MSCARVVAQAKLNLGLRVLAREASGFHTIETVFLRIELGDPIIVRTGGSARSIDCTGADVGPPESNLAYRAALAYAHTNGWPDGFAIEIEKVIPVGGGLGGGSADAGGVLRALNALAPRPMPERDLLRLASTLGSDVAFLTTTVPSALAWGRGERMLALPALPQRHVVLAIPPFPIPTAAAYGWLAASRTETRPTPMLVRIEELSAWESLAPYTGNDFEVVAAERHPEIPETIEALQRAGASIARMTGTGSTVYGIFARPFDVHARSGEIPGRLIASETAEHVRRVEVVSR